MMSFRNFRPGYPVRRRCGAVGAAGRQGGGLAAPKSRRDRRHAVVAVETALTLPVLIFLLFGSIEITNGIFVSQALATAGYEGAREASRPGATMALVTNRIDEILVSRGIENYHVTVTPELRLDTPRGVSITVTVSAPMNSLSSYVTDVTAGRTLQSSITMVRH